MNDKTTAGLGIYGLRLRLSKDYNEKLEGLTTGVRIMLDVCLQIVQLKLWEWGVEERKSQEAGKSDLLDYRR